MGGGGAAYLGVNGGFVRSGGDFPHKSSVLLRLVRLILKA
jgi:hypothetical protein